MLLVASFKMYIVSRIVFLKEKHVGFLNSKHLNEPINNCYIKKKMYTYYKYHHNSFYIITY